MIGLKKKVLPKLPLVETEAEEAPEEEQEQEEEEEQEQNEERPLTEVEQMVVNHETRIQALEAAFFRLKQI